MHILDRQIVIALRDMFAERYFAGDEAVRDLYRDLEAAVVDGYGAAITVLTPDEGDE